MKSAVALAGIALVLSAAAADYRTLHGSYLIGGATLIDPPPTEARDTHLYLDLDGATARDLYRALKAKPEDGVCGAPGDLTKRQGGVQCTRVHGGNEYHCAFGVELRTQRVVAAVVC